MYILHPTTKRKILIDTAGSRSMIDPEFAKEKYSKFIKYNPFEISTIHGTSVENFIVNMPMPELTNSPEKIQLHLFRFHKNFHILLGLDVLRQLKAVIDLNRNFLKLGTSIYKLHYFNTDKKLFINEIQSMDVDEENNFLDLSKFRTDHMNDEEKDKIFQIIKNYKEIFQQEPLSFTNQIKHQIKTKDEIPIYAKSYR